MEQQIRGYIEELFMQAPNTQKAYDMKQELTNNLIEKYETLLLGGMAPEEAYRATIKSIGDIRELFISLQDDAAINMDEYESYRKQHAGIVSFSVALYILSIVPVILFGGKFSTVLMLVMIAFATFLLVNSSMSKPKSQQMYEENVVEDFRNWQDRTAQNKQIKKSLNTVVWSIVLVLYFLISFSSGAWWITWLIFPLGAAVQGIISIFLAQNGTRR